MAFSLSENVALEKFRSRRGRASADGSTEMVYTYTVTGSNDIGTVLGYVDSTAPSFVTDPVSGGLLWRDEIDWDQIGDELWEVNVTYLTPDRYDQRKHSLPDLGEYELSWDTTGGTARITTSRATTRYPTTATNHKNAIGVDQDGNPQGVDIVIPAMKWTVTYRLAQATVSNAYGIVCELLTGTVNDDTFFGRPAWNQDRPGVQFSFRPAAEHHWPDDWRHHWHRQERSSVSVGRISRGRSGHLQLPHAGRPDRCVRRDRVSRRRFLAVGNRNVRRTDHVDT